MSKLLLTLMSQLLVFCDLSNGHGTHSHEDQETPRAGDQGHTHDGHMHDGLGTQQIPHMHGDTGHGHAGNHTREHHGHGHSGTSTLRSNLSVMLSLTAFIVLMNKFIH